jgi:hypothetical protein
MNKESTFEELNDAIEQGLEDVKDPSDLVTVVAAADVKAFSPKTLERLYGRLSFQFNHVAHKPAQKVKLAAALIKVKGAAIEAGVVKEDSTAQGSKRAINAHVPRLT